MDDETPHPASGEDDAHLLSFESRMRDVLLHAERVRQQAAHMAAESQATDARRRR